MKILRYLLYLILVPVVIFIFLLIYGTLSDYRPEKEILLTEQADAPIVKDSSFNLLIWNLGYCGLGDNMDFFYDGGEGVRSTRVRVAENMKGVVDFVGTLDSVDFLLFQEVDLDSRRSYRTDQLAVLGALYPDYHSSIGMNYDVFFVPLPPSNPYGKVSSGIATLGRFQSSKSVRHSFPGNYSWPMGVFMLDRCFLVNRYPLEEGKQLLVINTHNSAYDDGSLKKEQMEYLHGFLTGEYDKGNYIIVGGDWNQTPFGFQPEFEKNIFDTEQLTYIEEGYLPGDWTWLFDPGVPTNRRIDIPYDPVVSRTTVIDYYLLSPNLEGVSVHGVNLDFKNSDHHPVLAKIRMNCP